jgi:hypothetical protein
MSKGLHFFPCLGDSLFGIRVTPGTGNRYSDAAEYRADHAGAQKKLCASLYKIREACKKSK